MSAMSSQKRKIAKRYKDRAPIIRAAFKPEEYEKHSAHAKMLDRFENEESARVQHEEFKARISSV